MGIAAKEHPRRNLTLPFIRTYPLSKLPSREKYENKDEEARPQSHVSFWHAFMWSGTLQFKLHPFKTKQTNTTTTTTNTFCWITMWLAFQLPIKRWNWDKHVCERNTKQDMLRESVTLFFLVIETKLSLSTMSLFRLSTSQWLTFAAALCVTWFINNIK